MKDFTTDYSLWLCVTHQKWQQRHVVLYANVFAYFGSTSILVEGDAPSPVCFATKFRMSFNGHNEVSWSGEIGFNEDSWDILEAVTIWKKPLLLRVR